MTDEPDGQTPATPYHPEEMRATWDLRIGTRTTLHGSAR